MDGFANSILAGNKLVREAIESPNYVPGVSGWSIQRDGNSEFNDTTIRGAIHVVGDEGEIEIDIDAQRPILKFWNTLHNNFAYINVVDDFDPDQAAIGLNSGPFPSTVIGGDVYARVYLIDSHEGTSQLGFLRSSDQFPIGGSYLFNDRMCNVRAYLGDGTFTSMANVISHRDGYVSFQGSTDGATLDGPELRVGEAESGGYLHVNNEDWISMSGIFSNGWTNSGGSVDAQYKLCGDGFVRLRGRITAGTNTAGTLMLTMPSGYRPDQHGRYMCANGTGTGGSPGQVEIATTGAMTLSTPASTTLYLNNIAYSTV